MHIRKHASVPTSNYFTTVATSRLIGRHKTSLLTKTNYPDSKNSPYAWHFLFPHITVSSQIAQAKHNDNFYCYHNNPISTSPFQGHISPTNLHRARGYYFIRLIHRYIYRVNSSEDLLEATPSTNYLEPTRILRI